jgi:hypothetical protein
VFPLPPLVAAALVAIAALLATYLPRPHWLARVLAGARRAPPLGWYLAGVVLGPMLGLVDRAVLDALTPVLACAIGWIAAAAGARLAAPRSRAAAPRPGIELAGVAAAFFIPAALLYAALRLLPPTIAPAWTPIWPVIGVLSASVALAATTRTGVATTLSFLVTAVALGALLPHAHRSDWRQSAVWVGFAIVGTAVCALLAVRLGRQSKTRPAATITALCLAAGLGLATGTSPFLLCGLMGVALARWGPGYERLGAELTPAEPSVSTVLWVGAGAFAGGRFPAVYLAAVVLALWPSLGRRFATAPPNDPRTIGLALVLSFALTSERVIGAEGAAILTAVALALLATGLVPRATPVAHPLTPPTQPAEVTA